MAKSAAAAVSSATAPPSVDGSTPTVVDGSRATSDPYSMSREPDRKDGVAKGKQGKHGKPASSTASGAPIRTKTEHQDEKKVLEDSSHAVESVEHETRRQRTKVSRSKAEDDGGSDEYEEEDEESDDVLPEAQPAHPRNQVDGKTARFRSNALHVYGLDFLRTGHMDEIFSQFDHKFVEWINDSSANIIFGDPTNAKKALESLSFPKVGDEPWRRTPDILVSEDVPPIFLQMRLAASTDAKRTKKAMPKIVPEDIAPKGKGRGKGKRPKAGGKDLEASLEGALDDGPRTKRPRPPPTPEELASRTKRATRFKDWLAEAAPGEKKTAEPPQSSPPKVSPGKIEAPVEATDEELAKRRKRSERFAETEEAPSAPAGAHGAAAEAKAPPEAAPEAPEAEPAAPAQA